MRQFGLETTTWFPIAMGMTMSACGYSESAYSSNEADHEVSVRVYETSATYELCDDDNFWIKSQWRLSISPDEYRRAMLDLRITGETGAVYAPQKFVVTGLSEDGKTAAAAYPVIFGAWGDDLSSRPQLIPVPLQNVILVSVEGDVGYGDSKISLTAAWQDQVGTAWIEIEERGLFHVDLHAAPGLLGSMAGFFKVPFIGWFAQSIVSRYARETMAEYHNDFFDPARALAELVEKNRQYGEG